MPARDHFYLASNVEGWATLGARSSPEGLHRGFAAHWWQPKITFVTPGGRSAAGQPYPATVVVTDRGRPIAGMRLAFTVGGDELAYAFATTNGDGVANAPIAVAPGQEWTINVEEVVSSPYIPATGSTTHAWVAVPGAGLAITLAPPDDERYLDSRVGTDVPFTARVTAAAGEVADWDVSFALDGADLGTRATDEDGRASITVTRLRDTYA